MRIRSPFTHWDGSGGEYGTYDSGSRLGRFAFMIAEYQRMGQIDHSGWSTALSLR